jgi:hypothetical protein
MARYLHLDHEQLLTAARDYDELTDEAQADMRAEFARRNLDAPLAEEPSDRPVKLVTVRRYRDLSEAIVARSLLESAGLRVQLQDENLVRLDWQISNFIGGIRLQVEEEDAATATEMLEQPVGETIEFAGPFDASGPEFEQPACPKCGSREITFEGAGRGAALAGVFVLGLPLPLGRKTWVCESCQARWEDT